MFLCGGTFMNMIRNKILQLRKDSALSWESWAEQSNRSVETLKKQMQEESNPTLATLIGILAPLHATLEVMTDAEKEQLAQADILRDRVAALEKLLADARGDRTVLDDQITQLTATNKAQQEQLSQLQSMVKKLEQNIEAKEASIDRKEKVIARKDETIAALLRKMGVI